MPCFAVRERGPFGSHRCRYRSWTPAFAPSSAAGRHAVAQGTSGALPDRARAAGDSLVTVHPINGLPVVPYQAGGRWARNGPRSGPHLQWTSASRPAHACAPPRARAGVEPRDAPRRKAWRTASCRIMLAPSGTRGRVNGARSRQSPAGGRTLHRGSAPLPHPARALLLRPRDLRARKAGDLQPDLAVRLPREPRRGAGPLLRAGHRRPERRGGAGSRRGAARLPQRLPASRPPAGGGHGSLRHRHSLPLPQLELRALGRAPPRPAQRAGGRVRPDRDLPRPGARRALLRLRLRQPRPAREAHHGRTRGPRPRDPGAVRRRRESETRL